METSFDWINNIKPMKPEMLWLKDNFHSLTEVIKGDKVYYIDTERKPLFYYYQNHIYTTYIYINYDRIWLKLKKDFGLNDSEIQDVITEWLGETYNLRVFTPTGSYFIETKSWVRPII